MGVFRTKFVTENVEKRRETWRKGEREGEAQNTTFLNVSFRVSSVPDFLDDGSRQFGIIRLKFCKGDLTFFKQVTPHSSENAGVRRRKQNSQFHTTFARY